MSCHTNHFSCSEVDVVIHGGMGTDQLRELKRVQKENERLRKAVSDLTLDKMILTEAARGNF